MTARPIGLHLARTLLPACLLGVMMTAALSAQPVTPRSASPTENATPVAPVPPPAPRPRAAEVSGQLMFIWGDPPAGGEPAYQVHLLDAEGQTHALEVEAHETALVAQLQRVSGQRVTLAIDAPLASTGVSLSAAGLPRVRALRDGPSATAGGATATQRLPQMNTQRAYVTVLCKFPGIAQEPFAPADVQRAFAASNGGAQDYFREVSRGRLDLAGSIVTPWVQMPRPAESYRIGGGPDLPLLARDCLAAADSIVDYSRFGGVTTIYNGFVGCCAWGGSIATDLDGPLRRVGAVWMMNTIAAGTLWHELGHSFGLPHSGGPYFRVYDSRWDVMSDVQSGLLFDPPLRYGGSHFLAWQKHQLGLLPDSSRVEVAGPRWHGLISPHAAGDGPGTQLVMVPLPNAASGALLTVEARRRVGYDVALPGEGILLAHVDPARREPALVVDADGNGNVNDRGAIWRVGQRYVNDSWGVTVAVDSQTTAGWWVTVQRAERTPAAPYFERGTASHGLASVTEVRRDSVRVLAPGAWRVPTNDMPEWVRLEQSSGTGNGWLVYSVIGGSLPSGRARVTLRLDVSTAQPRSTFAIEAGVLAEPGNQAYLSRASRRTTIADGEIWSTIDSLSLRLTGTWATATWSLVPSSRFRLENREPRLEGTGPRTFRFNVASGRAPVGTLVVDTLRVTVQGPSTITLSMVDTIVITPAVAGWSLSARPGHATLPVGLRRVDSVQVSSPGGGRWTAFSRRLDTRVLRREGGAGDWMVFDRQADAPGLVVDTVHVSPSTMPAGELSPRVVDSITWVDVPLRLTTGRWTGHSTVTLGQQSRFDSVLVYVLGSSGIGQSWRAGSTSPRLRLHTNDVFTQPPATGRSGQPLRWSRVLTDMVPGRYIDTITVTLDGAANSPLHLVDTTVIVAPPPRRGDVDGDGAVTAADGLLVLRWLVQLPLPTGLDVPRTGDANCDGQVTVADALLLLQLEAGLALGSTCVGRPVVP